MTVILGYDLITLREKVDLAAAEERLAELEGRRDMESLHERVGLLRLVGKLDDAWDAANEALRNVRFSGDRAVSRSDSPCPGAAVSGKTGCRAHRIDVVRRRSQKPRLGVNGGVRTSAPGQGVLRSARVRGSAERLSHGSHHPHSYRCSC